MFGGRRLFGGRADPVPESRRRPADARQKDLRTPRAARTERRAEHGVLLRQAGNIQPAAERRSHLARLSNDVGPLRIEAAETRLQVLHACRTDSLAVLE